MVDTISKNWFVIYTKPRQELKVLERLTHLGIEAYTPTKIEVRKWSDRKKKVTVCLLPSMVLVCLEEKEVSKVFEVPGVRRYLFVHGERARVTNDEVLAMKHYIENTYQLLNKKDHLVGSKIKIPSLNQEAEIISVKGKRCIAQLELLGAVVSFQLN
ncbi:MAG: antitermination protein NusG [Flavobacteriales bacterium]|nr:antitermination protein NusG [Flavobacteriales bacterium]